MISKKLLAFILLACVIIFSGCETLEGMGRDYETLKKWDKKVQDVLW